MQSAARVGLLVVVFVVLLLGSYAVLGRSLFAPKTKSYYAEFDDANGVQAGTEVLMAGVKIGTVSGVALLSPKLARMKFEISDSVTIPQGSVAVLSSSLIGLGQNPVTIVPPAATNVALEPGATMKGEKEGGFSSLIPDGKQTIKELNKTLVAVRSLLEDQKLRSRASDLLASSQKTLDQFGKLAQTANALLAANQAQISRAVVAATNAVQDVRRVTFRVAELMDQGKLQHGAEDILAELKLTAKHADDLVASMNQLVNDPKLRNPAFQSASNMQQITETGKSIASNADQMTKNGVEISKNGIELSKNAVTLSQQANEIATKASKIEDQLQDVLGRVGGFFQHKSGPGPLTGLTGEMDVFRQTNPNYWRTDISFRYPLADGAVDAGVYDAFGSNQITLQYEKTLSPSLDYRYGVYASKPGVGVDYALARKLELSGDVWDINKLNINLLAHYDFGNGVVGWAGIDRLFDSNSPAIGIGVRR